MIKGHQDTFERKMSLNALITFADTPLNLITIQSSIGVIFSTTYIGLVFF